MKRYQFVLTGLAEKMFKERYAIHPEETWEGACRRVSSHVASAEKAEKIKYWEEKFYNEIVVNKFIPGGRVLYGSGRPRPSLLNCFVAPSPEDSREGWGQLISDFIVISGLGGGVGCSFSSIRPRGAHINGTGGKSSGAVSLMRIVNAAAQEIKDGGSRRAACLFSLNIDHPDIEEFVSEKLDKHKLNSANVSVCFDRDVEQFFEDVKNDKEIELKWNGKVHGKINAKEFWFKILKNAIETGEPGILNTFYANKMNNGHYIEKLDTTNPCGEVYAGNEGGVCCLGSIVLPRFVDMETGEINFEEMGDTVATAVRFLDDVLTVNYYPTKEIEQKAKEVRRIGLGVMGLNDFLVLCKTKYGSEKSIEIIEKTMDFIKTRAYETSTILSAEKGSFPAYDRDKFMKSNFVKTLKHGIKTKISDHGMRNITLMALAPTGTTSIISGVCGGIEPLQSPVCKRTYTSRKSDKLESDFQVSSLFLEMAQEAMDLSCFTTINDLSIEDHLKVQQVCQKHTDNSVSKTINLTKMDDIEKASKIIMKYFPTLKGLTLYMIGSRENEPIQPLPLEKAKEYIYNNIRESKEKIGSVDNKSGRCVDGKCEL